MAGTTTQSTDKNGKSKRAVLNSILSRKQDFKQIENEEEKLLIERARRDNPMNVVFIQ